DPQSDIFTRPLLRGKGRVAQRLQQLGGALGVPLRAQTGERRFGAAELEASERGRAGRGEGATEVDASARRVESELRMEESLAGRAQRGDGVFLPGLGQL